MRMILQMLFNAFTMIGLLSIVLLLHTIGNIISAILLGLRIKEICIFYGKPILSFKIQDLLIRVGLIPLGGHVKHYDKELDKLPIIKKYLATISGPLAMIALGLSLLGLKSFIESFFVAFKQIFLGAYSPFSFGEEYIRQLFVLIDSQSRDLLIGIFVTKFAAVNLLPIPGLNGGFIFAHWLISSNRPKLAFAISQVSMLFFSSIWIGWIIAFGAYVLKN